MSMTNQNDTARQDVTDRLTLDYAEMIRTRDQLLASGAAMPAKIADKEDLGNVSRVIVDLRDTAGRSEATRVAEKEPFLRGGQAVDGFFKNGIADPLLREMSRLNRVVDVYNQAILAAERKRREQEAREAERIAEEARQKAERARKPEIRDNAAIDADLAQRRAVDAREATEATPAGMVRERFDHGALVTMRQVKYAEVVDSRLIPLEALRPYLKPSAIEEAVRRWAVATEYSQTMAGVRVGSRDESVVR